MKRLAVFVSGTGSLLEAMIKDGLKIQLVLADRECRGLEIAKEAGIPTQCVIRTDFSGKFNRYDHTRQIIAFLYSYDIDFIAMAGFMTILDATIFGRYKGKIINSHPALLPLFKGDHAVRDALASGTKVTGCTIHLATENLDEGKFLAQE
jgi:phosphoribosylglycinamide formyltransferase-1